MQHLFPFPADTTAYLASLGLPLTVNIHDASGELTRSSEDRCLRNDKALGRRMKRLLLLVAPECRRLCAACQIDARSVRVGCTLTSLSVSHRYDAGVNNWEAAFPQLASYLGLPPSATVAPLNLVNATWAYAVEDIVMGALTYNTSSIAFFWIDWQQVSY